MEGQHFQYMDADSANAMLNNIGFDQALGLQGDKLAGLLGAAGDQQIAALDSNQLLNAAQAMQGEHYQFLDADSAKAMYDGIGGDQALNLSADQLGGIFGAMDPNQYAGIGGDQLFSAFNIMGVDQAVAMGGDNLAGMFGAMGAGQIAAINPADVLVAVNQIQGQDFKLMDSESAGGLVDQIGIDQALNLKSDQLAGLFGVLEGAKIAEFGQDRIVDAATAMSARDLQPCGCRQRPGHILRDGW